VVVDYVSEVVLQPWGWVGRVCGQHVRGVTALFPPGSQVLPGEARPAFRLPGLLRTYWLDRNPSTLRVLAQVHHAHAASTEPAGERVLRDRRRSSGQRPPLARTRAEPAIVEVVVSYNHGHHALAPGLDRVEAMRAGDRHVASLLVLAWFLQAWGRRVRLSPGPRTAGYARIFPPAARGETSTPAPEGTSTDHRGGATLV
jgi:hypothetical protein